MNKFGIYIHWPFCKSKCPYCDFFSRVDKNVDAESIVDSYVQDIALTAQKTGPRKVTSIFFGGGTPSLLTPQQIEKLINAVGKYWQLEPRAEVSLEANPNTQTPTLFADLKLAGINRLSLGVQSFEDTELKFLGRTHNAWQAKHAAETVANTFNNFSLDLIYALPNQNPQIWQQNLEQALSFAPKHLSLYQLTIEDGTFFAKKGIEAMEEEAAAELYIQTTQQLAERGLNRYEVSNYAKKGFECQHNMLYWQGDDYAGIGNGAHGRLKINNRFFATTHPLKFEELTPQERAQELLLMGLRLKEGINKRKFWESCGLDFDCFINLQNAQHLNQCGLICNTAQNLRATQSGFLVLNKIIEELILC